MPDVPMVRLRELPGVQRVTELTRNRRLFDSIELNSTMAEIEEIVVSLFGVTNSMLEWVDDPDDDPAEKAEWERNFTVTKLPYAEAEPFWTWIGWEISDGKGEELISAHWFLRPIIAAVRGLDEDALFTPDGSGKWPESDDEEDDSTRDARLADRLAADVAAFFDRQGRARK